MAHVLVTGAAGAIGRPVCGELLGAGHAVRAFDLVPTPNVPDAMVGDVADRDAVRRAMTGVDAVIHLAAIPTDAPIETLLGPNVLGVHAILQAARDEGVRRVVLASTIQTVGHLARVRRVTSRDRAPVNHYALTKVWAEEMGAMAKQAYGLEVVAARIAWMVRNASEAERMSELGYYDVYLSPRDAARFFRIAIEAATVDEPVLFVAGPDAAERVDLEPARRLGFVPRDRFPEGLAFDVDAGGASPHERA